MEVGWWWLTLGLVVLVLVLFYFWVTNNRYHWAKCGVAFVSPTIIFGSFAPIVFHKKNIAIVYQDIYKELQGHSFGGFFEFIYPMLMVLDPELIKEVTVKHFDHFADRRAFVRKWMDPLVARSLLCLKGAEWRAMRNRLSPAFTTNKLRTMFPLITRCGEQFARSLAHQQQRGEPLEFKEPSLRLTNDIIASLAFGVEGGAIEDPDSKFYKFVRQITNFQGLRTLIFLGFLMVPWLMEKMGARIFPDEVTNYFKDLVRNGMDHRQRTGESRADLLQLLMEAQRGESTRTQGDELNVETLGEEEGAAEVHQKHLQTKIEDENLITDEDIASQTFFFFLAGFDTVSNNLAFTVHELAVNLEIQERLRDEIDAAILENGGRLTYESVMGMKYLDMVVSESLRKYPPVPFSDRTCTKSFKVPGTDTVIEEGDVVILPFYALQRDSQYFSDPDKFDPERFNEENRKKIKPYTYLPFGSGPHNCIGMRFALLEVKVVLCYILAFCELRVCTKTQNPIQFTKQPFQMNSEQGFWLSVNPRESPSMKVDYLNCT